MSRSISSDPDAADPAAGHRVEANARLTGAVAAVLLVLLAIEGATVLQVRALLTPHVFVGMLLVPPVVVKIASTSWRFLRYYRGDVAYRHKGPPPAVLRMLGPFVVVLTIALFASGIVVLVGPQSLRHQALFVHKASFIVWLGAMTIHVIGHARETLHLGPLDWLRRTRHRVRGASSRQALLIASLVAGVVLAGLTVGQVGPYLHRMH